MKYVCILCGYIYDDNEHEVKFIDYKYKSKEEIL